MPLLSVTQAAIDAAQGTRLNTDKAPWQTYDEELAIESTPELDSQIAEYEQRRHEGTSTQNLELLAQKREENYAAAEEYRWASPEEYSDIDARMGRIMHSSELIVILRDKLKLKCWYAEHPQKDKLTLLVQDSEYAKPEVGCWVQSGYMPELTVMGFDSHGVPLAERYRGWRTVCLQLILRGSITEDQVNKYFGPPKNTDAYTKYNSILYDFRRLGNRIE